MTLLAGTLEVQVLLERVAVVLVEDPLQELQ